MFFCFCALAWSEGTGGEGGGWMFLSLASLCLLAFLLPSEYVAFAFLSVGDDVSFMIIYFFAFNPLKRFRLAFSLL